MSQLISRKRKYETEFNNEFKKLKSNTETNYHKINDCFSNFVSIWNYSVQYIIMKGSMSRSQYTVKKIKVYLRELGLKLSGHKSELIIRLESKMKEKTELAKYDTIQNLKNFKNDLINFQDFIDDNREMMKEIDLITQCKKMITFYKKSINYEKALNKCIVSDIF